MKILCQPTATRMERRCMLVDRVLKSLAQGHHLRRLLNTDTELHRTSLLVRPLNLSPRTVCALSAAGVIGRTRIEWHKCWCSYEISSISRFIVSKKAISQKPLHRSQACPNHSISGHSSAEMSTFPPFQQHIRDFRYTMFMLCCPNR